MSNIMMTVMCFLVLTFLVLQMLTGQAGCRPQAAPLRYPMGAFDPRSGAIYSIELHPTGLHLWELEWKKEGEKGEGEKTKEGGKKKQEKPLFPRMPLPQQPPPEKDR
ncbi:MAG: hypothetical protein ACYTAF_12605, partial [Planctomycetota bacterium]|jgi:hypothetical protein